MGELLLHPNCQEYTRKKHKSCTEKTSKLEVLIKQQGSFLFSLSINYGDPGGK